MTEHPRPESAKEISCRITRTLVLYVRENNQGRLDSLLEGLPFDEAYLLDTNNWVSHAFFQLLCARMIRILNDDQAVLEMAMAAGRFQSLAPLDHVARLVGSPKLIYLLAPKYYKSLKNTADIHLHDIGPSWAILEDRAHNGHRKTRFDCDLTRGALAAIPTFVGLPPAQVEEIQCQVAEDQQGGSERPDRPKQGCSGCLYHVRWEPNRSWWRRLLGKRKFYDQAVEDLLRANRLIQAKYDQVRQLAADLENANRKLASSEQQYRLLAENATDVIWVFSLSTNRLEYISPSVERIRGFPAEEALAQTPEQSLSPDSLKSLRRYLEEELARDGQAGVDPQRSRRLEVEHSLAGGGYAWAEMIVSFIRNHEGKPVAIMGVTRDISERKQAEAELAQSEKKYRDLFEHGMDLLCLHDMNGTLLETNIPFKEEYGWLKTDLEGLNVREFIPDRYKRQFDDYMAHILRFGSAQGLLRGVTKSGREVIFEYKNRLIRDEEGNPHYVLGAARDVTERVQAEKALKISEEKYREIVQYAPAGIYEFDLEKMKFISANDVMCDYSGYTKEEFLALHPYDLLNAESRKKMDLLVEEVFQGRKDPPATEYQVKVKNGREFWVLSNTKFFFEDGVPKRAMAVVHDLTQIRRAEAEKRELEIKLHNAQKLESLGRLAGGVAHDLNNILSGIVTYPELLLLDLPPDSPLQGPLQTIKRSGEKAAGIVQDLLTLARRGVATKKAIDLNRIVEEFMTSPEYWNITASQNNLEVDIHIAEQTLHVTGSEVHISKSLMNLVSNAVDAMPNGGRLTISTGDCYIDKPLQGFEVIPKGEFCTLEVADTGFGISHTDLQHIFEPFYTKKTMGRSGTGLGMSVVWGTLKDHEGYIDIETQEGRGTTFVLYFPASRLRLEASVPAHIDDYLGKGESILVIDDATEQRELTTEMLKRLGYWADSASSGEEAVRLIRKRTYDLLILDMIMPDGMNGQETYRQIININPRQKAVIASGYAETDQVHETQRLGAGAYVKKPYTLEQIGLAVRSELDKT